MACIKTIWIKGNEQFQKKFFLIILKRRFYQIKSLENLTKDK